MLGILLFPLLAPDTPEWVAQIAGGAILIVAVCMGLWGLVVEWRYKGPYTLRAASSEDKWRWAAAIMFWETGWVPLMGLVQPILSPHPNQWPGFPLICGATWIVGYAIAVLYKRWDLYRTLMRYRRLDSAARKGQLKQADVLFPLVEWFGSEELKRFYEEGYGTNDG